MPEIRVDFRSYEEWIAWRARHQAAFAGWRAAVLDDVRRYGFVEPISDAYIPPDAVTINPANLRESIAAAGSSSRERAGLLALALAHRGLPAERRNRTKILGVGALTRAARILRGTFTHFLAAEYLPTEAAREQHYPIPHLDLSNAALPDAAFDLFFSAGAIGYAADLSRVLDEIARMLRPGGIMVSVVPLNPAGRAMPPAEEAPAALPPGWEMLERARAGGFVDARLTLIVSGVFGIASAPPPGIFVMSALRRSAAQRRTRLPRDDFVYAGPRLRRCIGLLGLARSGTTLLCSILGVHPRIHAVYEPFNDNQDRTLPARLTIDDFFSEFPTDMKGKQILLLKETATEIAYLDRTAELLRSLALPIWPELIILLRNPLHTFLSVVDGQQRWWGGTGEISVDSFTVWASHNLVALARLLQLAREFDAVVVSYEGLVARKEQIVPLLMSQLGIAFDERQLRFEQHVDRQQVRGDVALAANPVAISGEPAAVRAAELAAVSDAIGAAPHFARVAEATQLIAGLAEAGAARFHAPIILPVMRALDELLRGLAPRRA